MSVAAIQLLDHLRENGVEDKRAIKIAEAFDQRVEDAMREAKAHADKNRAESEAQAERIRAEAEEKTKAQFVTVDEYHKRDRNLATREDLNTAIAAVRAEIAALRADNRATNRLILGGFITVVVGIVTIVAGIAALVVKAFIGV